MTARTLAALALLALLPLAAASALRPAPADPVVAAAGTPFEVDSAHSTLIYRIRHFGVSNFYGRINAPKGSFVIDPQDLAGSSIAVAVEIANMDAGNDGRDRFLKGPDFFNAREYPTAEFKSDSIAAGENGTYLATGTFTMHGVTKTITVPITGYTEKQTTKFGYRAGFEGVFTVKRSEYGMDLFVKEGTLGDEVTITVAIEGVRRPAA